MAKKTFFSNKNLKIGIIGIGMVGGALKGYFEKNNKNPLLYDKYKKIGSIKEVNRANVIFICVPTPYDKKKGFDLSSVESSIRNISGKKIIIIKSTVLPGVTEKFQKKYPQHKFLFNPEFLTEFSPDQDMCYPDRQIVGFTPKSYDVAGDILQLLPLAPFVRILPATEAEMVKCFGNTWLSTKVIFANQIYDLCKALGINYDQVVECAGADKRIGRSHLEIWHGGFRGYGGKCLPKDIQAFIQFADKHGVDLKLHKTVEKINNQLMKEQGIKDQEKFSRRE
jgi:UDPglucose 6-dehydrogenase